MPLAQRTIFDENDEFPWTIIQITYDAGGQIVGRDTIYDDGTNRIERFADGLRTETFQDDNLDMFGEAPLDGGAKAWETISTYYDPSGQIAYRATINDDGTTKFENFLDGVRTDIFQADNLDMFGEAPLDGGAKEWETISTFYDPGGQIANRETVYDDGTTKSENFLDGVRTDIFQADNLDMFGEAPLDGGAKEWETISTFYDPGGQIANRETVYDDGRRKTESFFDDLTITRTVDEGNAYNWTSQTTARDPDRIIISAETVYDNGIQFGQFFENGKLATVFQYDLEDAVSWDNIVAEYDADGRIVERGTNYDNGIDKLEVFDAGQRVSVLQLDIEDATGWESINTLYDQNGLIASREVVYDNGVVKNEQFVNGVRSQTYETDNIGASGEAPLDGGAKSWETITTTFDQNGLIATRGTLYDDGTTAIALYEDRLLQGIIREDVRDGSGGVYEWEAIFTSYDANQDRDAKVTIYDNADELIFIYEQQVLQARLEVDGDDSDSWQVRVTEYGGDAPVIAEYDTFSDLPDIYLEYVNAPVLVG